MLEVPDASEPEGAERLWQKVQDAGPWSIVVDTYAAGSAALDELLGPEQSFCARVDAEHLPDAGVLDRVEEPWALLVELGRLPRVRLAGLAQHHQVLVLDLRSDRLVRAPGGNGELLEALLAGVWVHSGDCIVANDSAAARLLGRQDERP
ncbi:MAG TPA: hypothetical protein VFV89_18725 [Nocardioides sp.]|uniref:hypothetical protein n=1 Tax=Nocardioides sp. TaxID=35761 RepID=UPI002E31D5EC|nr:hypothetical protein [Nocardioides sp.]HEX5089849.1 hypothetical protein [Nocardioides sp.]